MDVIFDLKFHLPYTNIPQKDFFEILPCANKVNFVTEFVIQGKDPPFYPKKTFLGPKKALHMEKFQKYFFLDHFSPSFLSLNINFRYTFHFEYVITLNKV